MQPEPRARSSFGTMPTLPRLREWREERTLSQRELADRSGVSRTSIIEIEGGRNAWPQTVRKLAKALGVKPSALKG
jgi:transcriptional regulator with XRE-family HTH domain